MKDKLLDAEDLEQSESFSDEDDQEDENLLHNLDALKNSNDLSTD